MKSYIILFLSLLFSSSYGFSQEHEIEFSKEINELNVYGKNIIESQDDSTKQKFNIKFKTLLFEVISNQSSFNYNFDSLKTISILTASKIKLYNWALPKTNGTFEYFAYVSFLNNKNEYTVVELIDNSNNIKSPESKVLTPNFWYGALYYKIIENKKIGKKYYTLLGWDGNNNLTNKKIIDVIQINNNGVIKLGAPIFKMEKKTQKRVIFEYTENAVMSLKYHANSKKIIFDYLIPSNSNLKGIPEYYGPALNRFDALKAGKGKWLYEPDTDVELDRTIKDHFWIDPKEK